MTAQLDSIEFTRYRCFRERQKVEFGRLTLVYGENNSGKSAVVRLPALLADSMHQESEGLNSNSELLRGASTRAVQWRGGLGSEVSPDTEIAVQLKDGDRCEWILAWEDMKRELGVSKLTLGQVKDGEFDGKEMSPPFSGLLPLSSDSKIKELWKKTSWLGTTRVGPSSRGIPLGRKGRIWGDGSMAEVKVLDSQKLRADVSRFYEATVRQKIGKESLGGDAERLVLEPTGTASHTVAFGESGSGLEYMFAVVTAAESLRLEGGLLIVEEPEAHLHPRLHQALAEFLIKVLADNSTAQILLETHSEVFLQAGMDAALPSALGQQEVAIYWTRAHDDGSASVERVMLDELGRPITPQLEEAFSTMGVMRKETLRKRYSDAD